tara:strand:+ start:13913 stop:14584 length:672 start_codon:yes stop_codon:yes gene_type:complete
MLFSLSEVTEVFKHAHLIGEDSVGAFKARLRKLQGEGVPAGANPGKGKRVEYGITMLIEMSIALEFLQAGLSPAEAATLIKAERGSILAMSLFAIDPRSKEAEPILVFSPEALGNLQDREGERDLLGAITFLTRQGLVELFAKERDDILVTGVPWRWIIVELRPLMLNLMAFIADSLDRSDEAVADSFSYLVTKTEKTRGAVIAQRLNRMMTLGPVEQDDGSS